jgi:hypothetical protein
MPTMQRVSSELEARLKALEADLRQEKSERIKRSMHNGTSNRFSLAVAQAPVGAIPVTPVSTCHPCAASDCFSVFTHGCSTLYYVDV